MSILITGAGVVSPRGCGPLRQVALADEAPPPPAGERGLVPEASGADALYAVRDFDPERWLPSTKTYLDPASAYTLAVVGMAAGEAGWQWEEAMQAETGIVLGSAFGCPASWQTYWARVAESGSRGAHGLLFSHAYHNTPASLASIEYRLKGYHCTLAGGRLSGLQALVQAAAALRQGHAQRVLAVAVEALATPWLRALRRHWRRQDKPGCTPAEGAAAFALEPETGARPAWASIDAWSLASGPQAAARAARQALERAGWAASDLDRALLQASGVPAWDEAALRALEPVLPAHVRRDASDPRWGEAFGAGDGLQLAYLLAERPDGERWLLASWDEAAGSGAIAMTTRQGSVGRPGLKGSPRDDWRTG